VGSEELNGPYFEALRRGFDVAREMGGGSGGVGGGCRAVHFLIGIAEGDGPCARALAAPDGTSLRDVVAGMGAGGPGAPQAYLHMQVQQGARSFAAARGERVDVAHLLVALLDQGAPEVVDALERAGLDRAVVRSAALAALGAPADQPAIAFEPATAAGTLDRPALPVAELDPAAWAALRWRQDHVPLSRLRRRSDTDALIHLERAAVWRLADRLRLDDDQRYSLMRHHESAVADKVAAGRPEFARADDGAGRRHAMAVHPRRGRRGRRGPLRFAVGWGAWLSNRRVEARNRWFRLRVAGAYRRGPRA
jgi:hypothetical protein